MTSETVETPQRARKRRIAGRLFTLSHYLTAFTLALKGLDKAEQHWHGHEALVIFLFAAAAIIAIGTALHHRAHGANGELLQASFYLLEVIGCAWIAEFLHTEGKHYLPYFFAAASAAFLVAFFVRMGMFFRMRRNERGTLGMTATD
jgi:hypothetical protein